MGTDSSSQQTRWKLGRRDVFFQQIKEAHYVASLARRNEYDKLSSSESPSQWIERNYFSILPPANDSSNFQSQVSWLMLTIFRFVQFHPFLFSCVLLFARFPRFHRPNKISKTFQCARVLLFLAPIDESQNTLSLKSLIFFC